MMGTLTGFPNPPVLAPRGEAALRSGRGTRNPPVLAPRGEAALRSGRGTRNPPVLAPRGKASLRSGRGTRNPPVLAPRGEAALRSGGWTTTWMIVALGLLGCATGPQRVTRLVGDKIVVTRAVSPEAYEHVARALLYEEEERWEDAAAELQRALPFDEDAAEVRAELAELFVRLGRLDDAGDQIDRSIATVPTVEGYLARAHLADARHDTTTAREARKSAVATALADENPEAIERTHLELADALTVALDLPAARETLRALERAAPETLRGRVEHAALAWALGDLDEGEAALTGALALEPADVDARLLLGELEAALGRAPAAKATFSEAIDRADTPLQIADAIAGWLVQRGETAEAVELVERTTATVGDPDGLVLASGLWRVVERPDRALDAAERAAKLGAAPARVDVLRAEVRAAKNDHAGAVRLLLGVPADAPEYVEARLRAAELLRDDHKLADADLALEAAATHADGATKDHEGAALLAIARSLVDERRGDAVRAARRLDDALAADPDEARLVLARAAVDDRRGEWRQALALAEKLLARDPRNVEALNFAGFIAADHAQDLPLATRRLQAAVALSPGSGGIVDSLGWVYFRAGDLARAGTFLEQAGRLEPGDPEILEHLGDLYARRGDRARALDTYHRAQGRKPSPEVARDLAERVRTLEAKSAAGR
jgi:tetratricopeptide (TPR) repeat protein